jgi:hypothetical protein
MVMCVRAPIRDEEAKEICEDVVDLLATWPALAPALQSGGLEIKASGIICTALEAFARKSGLVVLREYEHIDFALIEPGKSSRSRLEVTTVVEAKFNYAQQCGEIRGRLPAAIAQAQNYRQRVNADFAYVLYFVAAPEEEVIPPHPRDSGWGYWNGKLQPAVDAVHTAVAESGVRLLAEHSRVGLHSLYCTLVDCGGAR